MSALAYPTGRRENVAANLDRPLLGMYLALLFMGWANIYSAAYDPDHASICLLYTSPSPRDGLLSRMPSSA